MRVARFGSHDLPVPRRETEGAGGYDLRASGAVTIWPNTQQLVPTGFVWEIPAGFVGCIRPRSGLAVRWGIDVRAGVIDSDFRGQVMALLRNEGISPLTVQVGDRIAQMLVVPHAMDCIEEVERLPDTVRGEGGYGHTGTR